MTDSIEDLQAVRHASQDYYLLQLYQNYLIELGKKSNFLDFFELFDFFQFCFLYLPKLHIKSLRR